MAHGKLSVGLQVKVKVLKINMNGLPMNLQVSYNINP